MHETSALAKTLRPFWGQGRAVVSESPVDEAQHASGLVVPIRYDGDDHVQRGILLATASGSFIDTGLEPGTVVYYRGGVKILDVVVVDLEDVIAYEVEE